MVLSVNIMFGTSESVYCFATPLSSLNLHPATARVYASKSDSTKRLCTESVFLVHPFIHSYVHMGFSQRYSTKSQNASAATWGTPYPPYPFPIFADCTMTSNTLVGKPALGSSICWTFSEPQRVATSTHKVYITYRYGWMDVWMHGWTCMHVDVWMYGWMDALTILTRKPSDHPNPNHLIHKVI